MGTGCIDSRGGVAMETKGELDEASDSSIASDGICRTAVMHAMAGIRANLLRGK